MRYTRPWNKLVRYKGGGAKLHIPSEIINEALKQGGIDVNAPDLEYNLNAMKDNQGRANIRIRIRRRKEDGVSTARKGQQE